MYLSGCQWRQEWRKILCRDKAQKSIGQNVLHWRLVELLWIINWEWINIRINVTSQNIVEHWNKKHKYIEVGLLYLSVYREDLNSVKIIYELPLKPLRKSGTFIYIYLYLYIYIQLPPTVCVKFKDFLYSQTGIWPAWKIPLYVIHSIGQRLNTVEKEK